MTSFQLKLERNEYADVVTDDYRIRKSAEVERSGYTFGLVHYHQRDPRKRCPKTPGVYLQCQRISSEPPVRGWTLRAAVLTGSEFVSHEFNQSVTEVLLDVTDYDFGPSYNRQVKVEEIKIEEPFDWSKPNPDVFSDVILVAGGQEFYVCKATLATFSDLFRGMFIREFKEAKMPRCDVQGVKAPQLQELLDVIYHKSEIDARNVLQILELDDYLGMPVIKAKCFKVLAQLTDSEVSLSSRILLADQYPSLNNLLEATLKPLNTPTEVKKALPEDLSSLNHTTVLRLLEKMRETVKSPSEPIGPLGMHVDRRLRAIPIPVPGELDNRFRPMDDRRDDRRGFGLLDQMLRDQEEDDEGPEHLPALPRY